MGILGAWLSSGKFWALGSVHTLVSVKALFGFSWFHNGRFSTFLYHLVFSTFSYHLVFSIIFLLLIFSHEVSFLMEWFCVVLKIFLLMILDFGKKKKKKNLVYFLEPKRILKPNVQFNIDAASAV